MPALIDSGLLSQAVDDHIAWLSDWHRLAFVDPGLRLEQAKTLSPPDSFTRWHQNAILTLSQDQPALEQLAGLYDQLHKLARLVLIKTPDREPVASNDYDNVIAKFNELMQGLRRMEKALAAAASGLDTLTGLRSRFSLQEDLLREHNRFMRTGKSFAVAIMDIDHFKAINDTHGHEAGDRVLAAVADHVSRALRSFDDAYRIGGEEFLLCLKEIDGAMALKILERLRAGLENSPVTLGDGQAIPVTASFGLTLSAKDLKPDEMPAQADKALYRAKNEGRNRIVMAEIEAPVVSAG